MPDTIGDVFVTAAPDRLQQRLLLARRSFVTRRADLGEAVQFAKASSPVAGDLLLARVERIGQHQALESPQGRRQQMYEGDEIVVAFGNRYAPDQFDAVVPDSLAPCDLVAGGGIAARVRARHGRMKAATRIVPIGLLGDQAGRVLNVSRFALPVAQPGAAPVIVVVGTSMNAGKTTTAAGLIRGLSRAGLRVGATKITGTGSGGDLWSMRDAGARTAFDFTDAGFATTAGCELEQLVTAAKSLIAHAGTGNDIVIAEIADGLLQTETHGLLKSADFARHVHGVVLAAGDAMGAVAAARWLHDHRLPLKLISGCLTQSPLAMREAESVIGLPVATLEQLRDPLQAPELCLRAFEALDIVA
ncbi:malic enzyme protein [Asticcacaulis biprosthecium C19]|uniref:Malic enzyme protein n=1 Tax=Asticcacaulis biprosthecium C19 TaxID=715226 RepID=F4QIU4_9CAUL|nr:DUF1611 domain-containing protein [Asticcacaulis biprosthecium]EGF91853.1 malic enzyme protein [Asticcacaulis biprosthecium C19]